MSTRLTRNDVVELRSDIRSALASGRLNAWQTKFFKDVDEKLARFGTGTRLSQKQFATLRKGLGRVGSPSQNTVIPFRKPTNRTRGPVKPRRKFFRPNLFALVAVVALAILGFINSNMEGLVSTGLEPVTSSSSAGPINLDRSSFTVTDGDTIRLNGAEGGTRLVGFNTPETFRPRCDRGLQLGNEATARLRSLVQNASTIVLEPVSCACPPDTQGTSNCNFGRDCAVLRIDGRDVGDILISEGLAARFECGRTRCPPTPRPWCPIN